MFNGTTIKDKLLQQYLPAIMGVFILGSLLGFFMDTSSLNTGSYYCPPCGCGNDHIEFHEEGLCEACSMPLIAQKSGAFAKAGDFFAEHFRGSSTHGTLYSRVVYPTLFGGIFFGILSVLFFRKKSVEIFLALLVVSLSLFGLKFQTYGTGYALFSDINMAFLPGSFLMFVGPLLYFHSRNILENNFKFERKELVHFIPGAIFFVAYVIFFLVPLEYKQWQLHTDFDPYIVIIEQFMGLVSIIIYISLVVHGLKEVKKQNTDRKKNEVKWLERLFLATYILIAVWVFNLSINAVFFELKSSTLTYFSLWVTLCLYLYWIGFEVFRSEKVLILKQGVKKTVVSSDLDEFKKKVENVMSSDRPFNDPNLTLKKLSEYFDVKPKELSGLINIAYQKNFYSLINEYRIEEVKRLLLDNEFENLTIVAIAEKAGFNSKSSFNSIFKKETGMTPREFKIQNSKEVFATQVAPVIRKEIGDD